MGEEERRSLPPPYAHTKARKRRGREEIGREKETTFLLAKEIFLLQERDTGRRGERK